MNPRIRWASVMFTVGVLTLMLSMSVSAETIRLKNGNTLQGEIKSNDGQWVKVEVPEVGELTLRAEEVASTEASAPTAQQQKASKQNPHVSRAYSALAMRQYDRAEREAQHALEEALQNKDNNQAKAMRAIIKQAREAQAVINQQQAAYEAQLAQQRKKEEEQEWERNKWKTTLDKSVTKTSFNEGEFKRIPKIRIRKSSAGGSTSQQAEPDLNQLSDEALYQKIVDDDGNTNAEMTVYHTDGRPPTTRTFTPEEQTAARKWFWDEKSKQDFDEQ